jgi:hypothetical protein
VIECWNIGRPADPRLNASGATWLDLPFTTATPEAARLLKGRILMSDDKRYREFLTKQLRQAQNAVDILLKQIFELDKATSAGDPDHGQDGGDDENKAQYRELARWVAKNLKKTQRLMVETLIESGGQMPVPDLQVTCGIGDFNRTRQRVDKRIRKQGWTIHRHDNEAQLIRLGGGQK